MDVVEEQLAERKTASSDKSESSGDPKQLNIGALLIEARENQKLTTQDIAEQMNLTVSVIAKIEDNEFEQDIPIAFIRGYVRSYAQKVGVDIENICAEFDRQTGQAPVPVQKLRAVSDFKKRREMNSNSFVFKAITLVIMVALFALGGWELFKRWDKPQPEQQLVNEIPLSGLQPDSESDVSTNNSATVAEPVPASSDEASITQTVEVEPVTTSAQNPLVPEVEESAPASTSVLDESAASASQNQESELSEAFEAEPVPLITGPVKEVVFTFTADCWVKVTDANGEVMAVGLKKAGKVMPVEGIAPIDVTLGEPTAVTVDYNGETYDMSQFRAGRAARFVLE